MQPQAEPSVAHKENSSAGEGSFPCPREPVRAPLPGKSFLWGRNLTHRQRGESLGLFLPPRAWKPPLDSLPHPPGCTKARETAADFGGLLLHMAWEQQLLSMSLQGVDSRGLRELGREAEKAMLQK